MKNKAILFLLFTLFFISKNSAQDLTLNQQKISRAVSKYFEMDRENIHLHLNKTTFVTFDAIWFKGYITEKKTHKLYTNTTNVYVSLYDKSGTILKTNLYYAENGTVYGNFKLDENFKTGDYYLKSYTNYMNNYLEDESSTYKITIINPLENKIVSNKINYNSINASFYPESGLFLEGCSNVIATKIVDCNNNPISSKNIEVYDSNDKYITKFSTDKFGVGRFEIKNTIDATYKIIISLSDKKIEKILPKPTLKGITFSIDNYSIPNKTSASFKTNKNTINEIKDATYTVAFQKNNSTLFLDFSFKNGNLIQDFVFDNEILHEGLNSIRLIDNNLTQIGERLIYNAPLVKNNVDLSIHKKEQDSITISGVLNSFNSEISISVLPEKTIENDYKKTIFSVLDFDGITENSLNGIPQYISEINNQKSIELDNLLIFEKSKYEWTSITTTKPTETHPFDIGISIKGTVANAAFSQQNAKVKMSSVIQGIQEFAPLNDKNEFIFDNFIAIDSTYLNFEPINFKENKSKLALSFQLQKNKRNFLKPLKLNETLNCNTNEISFLELTLPENPNATVLNTVTVSKTNTKDKLSNIENYANKQSKGEKITDAIAQSYVDVISYIAAHGYQTQTQGGDVKITARVPSTWRGSRSPQIFVDDSPQTNFNLLSNMNLRDIEEIYINQKGFGGDGDSANGIIRIYSKKTSSVDAFSSKSSSTSLVIKDGFMPQNDFKNLNYANYQNDGFKKLGTIHWIPKIVTDANGNFKFTIPNYYQSVLKINIEGISPDGKLIAISKTLQVE